MIVVAFKYTNYYLTRVAALVNRPEPVNHSVAADKLESLD